jgi:diaminopimelate epimerase
MRFTKMHGLGNDYVYVNCFAEQVADPVSLSRAVSDRHKGIGSDGLILICPSERADVRMEMYNADGSRAQMCGNGIRCVARYAYEHGLIDRPKDRVPGTDEADVQNILDRTAEASLGRPAAGHAGRSDETSAITVETDAGVKTLGLSIGDGCIRLVCVDMGQPSLSPGDLPCTLDGAKIVDRDVTVQISVTVGFDVTVQKRTYQMTCVSVGNPHAIIFLDDLDIVNLPAEGPAIENAEIFPERINAHFVRVDGRDEVTMVTWERGSGATLACGTGATAVCVAGAVSGRTDRSLLAHLPGGDLHVNWGQDNHVYMSGPASEVFTGDWPA